MGFIICPSLSFSYIEKVCCKVLKMLGFLKRITSDYKLFASLKTLSFNKTYP